MSDILRKTLLGLSRFFRGKENAIKVISSPELGDINYRCDGCSEGIKEGEFRYNCDDCPESFDLCQSCYESGIGESHKESLGHLHEFTCETRNNYSISRDVKGESLEDTLVNMFKFYANRPAIGSYIPSRQRYEYISFRELEQLVSSCVSALHHVMSSDHTHMVSMCSVVRLEWYIVDYACAILGIPTVGIAASSDEDVTGFILNQTESSFVFCSSGHLSLFLSLVKDCPHLREIIVMDLKEDDDIELQDTHVPSGVRLWRLTEFLSKGTEYLVDYTSFKTDPDVMYTIAYTSGSTGKPKGCVFTRNLWFKHLLTQSNANILGIKRIWFSFQPPSHLMERESFHMTLFNGSKSGIYRGSMEHLFHDIKMVGPTVLTSTPRFFSIIYNQYLQELYQEYNTETNSSPSILDLSVIPYQIKDKVKKKFKDYLGGRERMIGIGGAAVPPALLKFLSSCFNGLVQEGYGTTEAGSITSGDWSLGDVTIRLRDVPEMGYLTTDTPPRGEVCVQTAYMITGYYKNTQDTQEKFKDGYFCTGDIGVMQRPGYVKVIDRKKNIFKLAQGEFVAPERIETIFEDNSSFIEQVYVYGNIWQTNVVALVIPHKEQVMKWWEGQHKDTDIISIDVLCSLADVHKLFMNEMRMLGEAHKLQGWEIPSAILLKPDPFTEENHMLTCTLKKSRPQLEKKYKHDLEMLYEPLKDDKVVMKRSIEEEIMIELLKILENRSIEFPSSKYSQVEPSKPLNMKLTLTQLGGDSLVAMSLSNLLLEQLIVTVSAVYILKHPIIDLFQHVLSQLSPGQDINDIGLHTIDWVKETGIHFLQLSASSVRLTESTSPVLNEQTVVLLTGSTGFLGRYILWELLNSSNCSRIYCLCRDIERKPAQDRITAVIKELLSELPDKGTEYDLLASKYVVISGDISKPRLGLSESDFTLISQQVNVVIHNGANVNHLLFYSDLKTTNVQSTKEIIKFCCQSGSHHKYLHYVSSLGVFALLPNEVVEESTQPNIKRMNHLSGYSQTKWVSEQLILKALSDGFIKGSISRPGLIGAHSITGHSNNNDWFYQLVCGLAHLKCYPIGPSWDSGAVPIVAVDIVAKAIVHLSLNQLSSIYHLGSTDLQTMVTFSDVIESLKKVVPDTVIQPLDEHTFMERLSSEVKSSNSTRAIMALYLLLSQAGGNHPMSLLESIISNELTIRTLEPFGISLNASTDDGYMSRYISYLNLKEIL